MIAELLEDVGGFGHSSGADLATAQPSAAGFDEVQAVVFQLLDISLYRRLVPHFGVHGRGDKNRTGHRQDKRRHQIVRVTVSGLCQEICSRGGDEVKVGSSREADVFALWVLDRFKEVLIHGAVREGFESCRSNELFCGFCHRDGDRSSGLHELAGQIGSFVRGDSARNADQDFAILEDSHGWVSGSNQEPAL